MKAEDFFVKTDPLEIQDNAFKIIGNDWFLITAGTIDDYNTMTAGWGFIGNIWNKPAFVTFIRPTRYTWLFAEKYNNYTICFFDNKYRSVLNYCGSVSGKDTNKVKDCKLTPLETKNGNIVFKESRLIFECNKIYSEVLKPDQFAEKEIDHHYPKKDYHSYYFGEIINCLKLKDY